MPVLGSSAELAAILDSRSVASVVISSDKIPPDRREHVLSVCRARDIPVLHAHLTLQPIGPNGQSSSKGNGDHHEGNPDPAVDNGSSVLFRQGSR